MCTSFRLDPSESARIRALIDEVFGKASTHEECVVQERLFDHDLRPNDQVITLHHMHTAGAASIREVSISTGVPTLMRWGFPGFKSRRPIVNARAETAASKPLFADSLSKRRCLVPASGFHEWDADKNKYEFRLPDAPELFLGGFFSVFEGEKRCCILTTKPNSAVAPIHDRMPVVVPFEQAEAWLADEDSAMHILHSASPMLDVREISHRASRFNGGSRRDDGEESQMQLW